MPPGDFSFWAKSPPAAITKFIFNWNFGLNNDSNNRQPSKVFGFEKQEIAQWWECSPPSAYQCAPGSNAGVDAICGLSLLLILSFAPKGFSLITPVFPCPQKPTFSNSNSTRNHARWRTVFGCATSKSLLLCFYFYLFFLYLLFKIWPSLLKIS